MLTAQTRLSNLELDRLNETAFKTATPDRQVMDRACEEVLVRHAEAKKVVLARLVEGYGARNIQIPPSVWIAGSPVEAADMLRRPGVEVVMMPIGQSLCTHADRLKSNLPTVDPTRGIPTSWALNQKEVDGRRVSIVEAEPVFTEMVVGGKSYSDPQNRALISSALGLLAVCQLAHPESNNWQLGITREDHTSARTSHIHRGEISAVLGAVGPGVQIKNRLIVDGAYADLFVPPHVAAFFKGPRQFAGPNIFSRYGTPHQTPAPTNTCFPYEQRLAVVCYANDSGSDPKPSAPSPTTVDSFLEIYTRHLSNWLFKLSAKEVTATAKSFVNLE